MSIRLSARLQAIADLVPAEARVIDVGTDHAMIPVWLAQTGRAAHVWASDIRPGPLESAERLINATSTGGCVETRLADGLSGFGPQDCDTVIIGGMGGETMTSILSAAPWTKENIRLILAPQTKQDILRGFLLKNGYETTAESLVEDSGRIYSIITAAGGTSDLQYDRAELHVGAFRQISRDPLFPPYLEQWIKRIEKSAPYDPAARQLLEEFLSMKERFIKNADCK